MSSLSNKLISEGGYKRDHDSMIVYNPTILGYSTLEFAAGFTIEPPDRNGIVLATSMDIHEKDIEVPPLLDITTIEFNVLLGVDSIGTRPLKYSYVHGSNCQWNKELGISKDSSEMIIYTPDKVGHLGDLDYRRSQISDVASIFIEGTGDSGSLEPDDPSQPPDEPPYEPGDDPGHTVVVGGLEEVAVTINPNSMYTIKLKSAKGVEITGVEGLDRTMSWDFTTKTLTGGVFGTHQKKVTVKLGDSSATLLIKAEPVSRHLI